MLKTYTFGVKDSGPNVLILGCIHGNEPCGNVAIMKLMAHINMSQIKIKQGTVTLIPVCNPVAHKENIRYKEENLNRIFKKYDIPTSYEQGLANEISSYIDNCDYLLDIHSTTEDAPAFVFQDYSDLETKTLAESLKISYIISGWGNIYGNSEVGDTISYAYEKGKKGVLVECGQHVDEKSEDIAYYSIINFLEGLGVIKVQNKKITEFSTKRIQIVKVHLKKYPGKFLQDLVNFDIVKKGETIGIYDNGDEIKVETDGYIIMPNDNVRIGEDWFYLGVDDALI